MTREGQLLTRPTVVPPSGRGPRTTAPVEVALLDRSGVIVAVNPAWDGFCRDNGGDPGRCGPGVSYLDVCDRAGDAVSVAVAAAIRRALDGGLPAPLLVPVPCDAPDRPRLFELLVSTRYDRTGRLVGATVTLAVAAPGPSSGAGIRLRSWPAPGWAGPVLIRAETPADHAAVADVQRAAFGDDVVPELVDRLRRGPGFVDRYSLVAVVPDDGSGTRVAGHVMLTRIPLEALDGATREVLCLSPLGVLPDVQGRGIGSALVVAACAAADADGEPFVVLEGNPALYSRFGFVGGHTRGLRRPSEHCPPPGFQVRSLAADRPDDPALRGRVLYPEVFWAFGAVGRPMDRPAFLDALERACRVVEGRCRHASGTLDGVGPVGDADAAALAAPVPACPGWTVADVLRHLGFIHRFVATWVSGGRRPAAGSRPAVPPDDASPAELLAWFGSGWRDLQDLLDARGPAAPTATWSPWDATAGFWFRRMAHEAVVHAMDVVDALPHKGSLPLLVPDDLALDGVDEVVRLWLGTRLGPDVGGSGEVVRLVARSAPGPRTPATDGGAVARGRLWTVGLHGGITETHDVPTSPDAAVTADPQTLYRWLWGRAADDQVVVDGDPAAVRVLRAALTRALQ